jgi:hypothetical protein
MPTTCVMYSFGCDYKLDFEDAVARAAGCEIHVFDPTLPRPPKTLPPKTEFHDLGIYNKSMELKDVGRVESLQTIMSSLGIHAS